MNQVVRDFIAYVEAEEPKLAQRLEKYSEEDVLAELLGRFDLKKQRTLSNKECALARRILGKLHTPSVKGLGLLGHTLDYLGLSQGNVKGADVELAVEVLELFCKADSVNDTLSSKELSMLITALKTLDTDDNGVLDEHERTALRDGLWTPDEFLAELLGSD